MIAPRPAAALVLAAALLSCSRVRKAEKPDAPAPAPKAEAPDSAEEKGVPPREGRPRVPSSPEALLAEGAVTEIQRALARRDLLGKHVRGELDAPTSAALRRFQKEEGLAQTGFPDRETLRRLGIDPEKAYGRAEDEAR